MSCNCAVTSTFSSKAMKDDMSFSFSSIFWFQVSGFKFQVIDTCGLLSLFCLNKL
jgi:hypothetical protein